MEQSLTVRVLGSDAVLTSAVTVGLQVLGWPAESVVAISPDERPGAIVLVGDRSGHLPLLPNGGRFLRPPRAILICGAAGLAAMAVAVRAGAQEAFDADCPLPVLIDALDATLRRPVGASVAERVRLLAALRSHQAERARFLRLTDRERQVLDGLLRGRTASEIAAELQVSVPTVRTQLHHLLTKLEVHSQVAAIALAHRLWPVPLAAPATARINNSVDDRASWLR